MVKDVILSHVYLNFDTVSSYMKWVGAVLETDRDLPELMVTTAGTECFS